MRITRHYRRNQIIAWTIGVIVIGVSVFGIYWFGFRANNPIPTDIQAQLTFSPLVIPKGTDNFETSEYKFATVENGLEILSFIITTPTASVSVSEYPQPIEFIEIPEYKDRFLTNAINQYSVVPSSNGSIYLGRAVKQDNRQLAIMIERGLLVFMNPDKELSEAEWRSIGDQLEIQKVNEAP
jgi:hypothetical protein